MRFEDFVGLRYLMAKRDRNMLSVITLISVGGVAVGVMALIVVLSVMGGFEADFREKIIGSKAHVVVSAEEGYLEDYVNIMARVRQIEKVEGVNAYVEAEVMLNSPTNLQTAIIRGIQASDITSTTRIEEYLEEGKLEYLENPDALPSIATGGYEIKRGSLTLQSDSGDGGLSPERAKALERAGAKASVAFAGSKHGAWVGGKDVLKDEKELIKEAEAALDAPSTPPEIIVDPIQPMKAPVQARQDQIAKEDLSEEDRLLLEEIGEDRWVTDEPTRMPAAIGVAGEDVVFDREPTAEIVGMTAQKRSMKAMPGLTDADVGVRRVGGIILGRELKQNLAMYMGGEVNVMSPTGDVGPAGGLPKSRPFKLVGSYYSGMFDFDAKMGYISLSDAQALLGIGDRVTGIDVRCTRVEDSLEVRDTIREALKDMEGVKVDDWMTLNSSLFSAIMLEKVAMFTILTSIILVASFNILCLLIMMVTEKAREIAIFKAMGTATRSIIRMFVVQGAAIGVLGTIIGAGLGLGICYLVAALGFKLPGGVYYITQIPVTVNPYEVVTICVAAIVISLLATIWPSYMAVKLDPVEGLRHE